MKITKVKETGISDTSHKVDVRKLFDKDIAQAVHIKLEAGESLKPHITPVDAFFYVIEGTPEILVGKDKQLVEADCLVESPKFLPHSISNNSNSIARILVIKFPKPITRSNLI